jgi:pyruvate/2-oxoglutarate dehydrogenase complex dihydrolipoamide acyltransferase (E2) component
LRREVKIPKWGLTIEKMTILSWLKAVGDDVEEGEALCEVDTDKSQADIESPARGQVVELRADEGDECSVGEVIAVLETA